MSSREPKVVRAGLDVQIGKERFQVPVDRPEFERATIEQLLNVQLIGDRLRWRALGVEISIETLARVVPARRLRAMKRAQQTRDREDLASGRLMPDEILLIRPERIGESKIRWPDDSALDD